MTPEVYKAATSRYSESTMAFNRCGESGLILPAMSLGMWWNFGGVDPLEQSRQKMLWAFDNGIYCYDLANNYGPPYGSAEETFGSVFTRDLKPYRQEIVVTTKAGYDMWPGPTGIGSSRRMLITSIEQSLKRMRLEYVDIFYSHRYDPNTPLEETVGALEQIVRAGKAIYVGLSNYPADKLDTILGMLKASNVPCVIYQGKHNLLYRENEKEIINILQKHGIGYTVFSPLAKGLLSDKYLHGIPTDSRAFLQKHFTQAELSEEILNKVAALSRIAEQSGQSLAQMAVSWLLNMKAVTSVILGPRTMQQFAELKEALKFCHNFTEAEISQINAITQ